MPLLQYAQAFNPLRTKKNPDYAIVNVTSRCNARCVFCHYWERVEDPRIKKDELSADEFEKIARRWGKITKLEIAGGEPFVREDLDEIVRHFNRHTDVPIVDIPTNGTMPSRVVTTVERILKHSRNILEIQLSFQAGEARLHDDIVKVKGAFEKIIETSRLLSKLKKHYKNLKIKLNIVYIKDNRESIAALVDLVEREFDLDRFAITYPHGRAKDIDLYDQIEDYKEYCQYAGNVAKEFTVSSKKDLHTLVFRAVKDVLFSDFEKIMKERNLGKYCQASKKMVVIGETGKVFPCEGKWELLGDLRDHDYDLARVLASRETKRFRQASLGDHKCHCTWSNAILCGIVNNPKYYPRIIGNMTKLAIKKEKRCAG